MTLEWAIVAVILYVQLGIFLLGYLFYRRLALLRRDVEHVEHQLAESQRNLAVAAGAAERKRRLLERPPQPPPRLGSARPSNQGDDKALGSAHQRVQLLQRAHLFNLRRADLDFLTRVHRLKRIEAGSWELPPVVEITTRDTVDSR